MILESLIGKKNRKKVDKNNMNLLLYVKFFIKGFEILSINYKKLNFIYDSLSFFRCSNVKAANFPTSFF